VGTHIIHDSFNSDHFPLAVTITVPTCITLLTCILSRA